MPRRQRLGTPVRRRCRLGLAAAVLAALALGVSSAPAQDLQTQLSQKQARLSHAKSRDGVLTSTIQHYSDRIDRLRAEVASLRNREAVVQTQLVAVQAQLDAALKRLAVLRSHLVRALDVLGKRLVAIYKSGEPDLVTVILGSNGFEDLVTRTDYLDEIHSQDASITVRVRDLRDQARGAVDTVRVVRDQIAAKRAELARTDQQLAAQQGQLAATRQKNQAALRRVRATEGDLSDHVAKLQSQIAAQLQAAGSTSALPAGPIRPGSAGFIWPVNGPITSPFGPRAGGFHPGLDIGAPSGTPIRAAKAGAVVLIGPNGGYGNYTCLNHGGGLSTCYAHQSAFATSMGASVAQGQVIGYVGSTGFSTGPHLHFEVRVNGTPQDPLNYL